MPLLSEYQCCVSAWATFIVGFRASPVSIGTNRALIEQRLRRLDGGEP
jgi:hypothetical protein